MQVKHVGFGIRGFYRVAKMGQNLGMKGETAEKRLEILKFWRKHGLEATKDAYRLSRRTLYRWQQRLSISGDKLEANKFFNSHLDLLFTDPSRANRKLANFLILYNTQLPHHAGKLKTPIQAFAESTNLCHNIWTNTWLLTSGVFWLIRLTAQGGSFSRVLGAYYEETWLGAREGRQRMQATAGGMG